MLLLGFFSEATWPDSQERQEAERKSLRPMKIACSLQMKPLEHRDGVAGMVWELPVGTATTKPKQDMVP